MLSTVPIAITPLALLEQAKICFYRLKQEEIFNILKSVRREKRFPYG